MKAYRKIAVILARPYEPGEGLDGVRISPNDVPSNGGYIAQQPDDKNDRWFVSKEVFERTYVEV